MYIIIYNLYSIYSTFPTALALGQGVNMPFLKKSTGVAQTLCGAVGNSQSDWFPLTAFHVYNPLRALEDLTNITCSST